MYHQQLRLEKLQLETDPTNATLKELTNGWKLYEEEMVMPNYKCSNSFQHCQQLLDNVQLSKKTEKISASVFCTR